MAKAVRASLRETLNWLAVLRRRQSRATLLRLFENVPAASLPTTINGFHAYISALPPPAAGAAGGAVAASRSYLKRATVESILRHRDEHRSVIARMFPSRLDLETGTVLPPTYFGDAEIESLRTASLGDFSRLHFHIAQTKLDASGHAPVALRPGVLTLTLRFCQVS